MISTAVISYGVSARTFHIPFLTTHPGFSLDMILQRQDGSAGTDHPKARLVRTMQEVIDDPGIQLVVIASPNTTHFDYTKMALLAGKHVVVEKPFTIASKEAKELIRITEKTKKVCAVYQNRRYVGDYLTMKEIIEKGLLGETREFFAHYDRYRPDPRTYGLWREDDLPGSGIFYDLGPHLIDQSLALFGKPSFVTADIRRMKNYSKVDDYFDVKLEYDQLIVTLHSSQLVREMGPRYMIHGTKGSYIKYGEDPQEEILKSGLLPVTEDWGLEKEDQFGWIHTEKNGVPVREKYPTLRGHYGKFYDEVHQAITLGIPHPITPYDGYWVMKTIERAIESSKRRRTLPW